jgi:hypothetical protein
MVEEAALAAEGWEGLAAHEEAWEVAVSEAAEASAAVVSEVPEG